MEKFDVSYRVAGDQASLVTQLVPHQRQAGDYRVTGGELAMYCDFSHAPVGLIPWMIVRTRRFSVMKHWRKGVYLEHPEYDARALLEMSSDLRLDLRVSGDSRLLVFDILRDTVEELVRSRWPGLSYKFRIPCRGSHDRIGHCPGSFPVSSLERKRSEDDPSITCVECLEQYAVSDLMGGFPRRVRLDQEMALAATLNRVDAKLSALLLLSKAASAEVDDCPRLFTIHKTDFHAFDPRVAFKKRYKLQLWCEELGHEHPVGDPYSLNGSREWFAQGAPYLRLVARAVSLVAPIGGGVAGVVDADDVRASATLMKSLADAVPGADDSTSIADDDDSGSLTASEGAALRSFREMLFSLDKPKRFRGLRRALSPTGDYVWLCPEHYIQIEPSLPQLGAMRALGP